MFLEVTLSVQSLCRDSAHSRAALWWWVDAVGVTCLLLFPGHRKAAPRLPSRKAATSEPGNWCKPLHQSAGATVTKPHAPRAKTTRFVSPSMEAASPRPRCGQGWFS